MSLLPVDEALSRLLKGAEPKGEEKVSISDAHGRILSQNISSNRAQPPFNASAMDGYAVRYDDACKAGMTLRVVGESAAGRSFTGVVNKGEAVRIFTGAPVPAQANTILIQENTKIIAENVIKVTEPAQKDRHIRLKGVDFDENQMLLEKSRRLDYSALTLAACMNQSHMAVFEKPDVYVLATGDELVEPGGTPDENQIISSNSYGVVALCSSAGASAVDLGIAADNLDDIKTRVQKAIDSKADILVTIGGASVGDYDLVQKALIDMGMELNFWKIAMRPGKPLMFGQLGNMRFMGLPGNPASCLVTANLFLAPLVRKLSGNRATQVIQKARTTVDLTENASRQDYMRARIEYDKNGNLTATPFSRQDSSLVRVFADANGLLIRPPNAKPAKKGDTCDVILLDS
ncbi:gephyrin-like molybdotransferase Glp [Lentilitoribacter sp. Alg239-R112]|uniref:molybdopterin molybdotransferase MoeA n=1 Tax=Lentilitoribacter sp. Alg239-R112 TaxID=2305987 RepID=UPI0013A69A52|nr:gephyrin-like molybdotransferase Glp [Lentilitoribacter sp. Alg239-R112]